MSKFEKTSPIENKMPVVSLFDKTKREIKINDIFYLDKKKFTITGTRTAKNGKFLLKYKEKPSDAKEEPKNISPEEFVRDFNNEKISLDVSKKREVEVDNFKKENPVEKKKKPAPDTTKGASAGSIPPVKAPENPEPVEPSEPEPVDNKKEVLSTIMGDILLSAQKREAAKAAEEEEGKNIEQKREALRVAREKSRELADKIAEKRKDIEALMKEIADKKALLEKSNY